MGGWALDPMTSAPVGGETGEGRGRRGAGAAGSWKSGKDPPWRLRKERSLATPGFLTGGLQNWERLWSCCFRTSGLGSWVTDTSAVTIPPSAGSGPAGLVLAWCGRERAAGGVVVRNLVREVGPGPHPGPRVPCWGVGGAGTPKSGPVCASNNPPNPGREQRPGPSGRRVAAGAPRLRSPGKTRLGQAGLGSIRDPRSVGWSQKHAQESRAKERHQGGKRLARFSGSYNKVKTH